MSFDKRDFKLKNSSINLKINDNIEDIVTSENNKLSIKEAKESHVIYKKIRLTNFKQLSKNKIFKIPIKKPNIEEIINIIVDAKIGDTKVIKGIKGKSIEGQILTGYKLIVEGTLSENIEYTSCWKKQSIHSVHFKMPFSSYIILPEYYKEGDFIKVEAEIEDVSFRVINNRTVFNNIIFLLIAKKL
ncbi:DUF3794 domain-containing protein [Clostridium sporogenes]|uniref:DUF3794 domain-containing protein n=1 Tax=Clostridium sporogenes TaxID=1509 RepID=UPI003F921EDC